MERNPYSNDDFAKASEYLRLAISLLSKNKIPASPLNFRIGYDYVAGNNEELTTAFNENISQSKKFTTESLWTMYQHFFIQDEKALGKMREELHHIIVNIQSEFELSGGNLSSYAGTLNRFADLLGNPITPGAMSTEVQKVINDTHSMEQSQHRLELQISSILTEMQELQQELEQVRVESLTDARTASSI